jgi:hypothetical protein
MGLVLASLIQRLRSVAGLSDRAADGERPASPTAHCRIEEGQTSTLQGPRAWSRSFAREPSATLEGRTAAGEACYGASLAPRGISAFLALEVEKYQEPYCLGLRFLANLRCLVGFGPSLRSS